MNCSESLIIRSSQRSNSINNSLSYDRISSESMNQIFQVQPPRTRAGSINRALINPKTPFTTIPNSRKGSRSSQIRGYSSKARTATGQQIINNSSQSKNFKNMGAPQLCRYRYNKTSFSILIYAYYTQKVSKK